MNRSREYSDRLKKESRSRNGFEVINATKREALKQVMAGSESMPTT